MRHNYDLFPLESCRAADPGEMPVEFLNYGEEGDEDYWKAINKYIACKKVSLRCKMSYITSIYSKGNRRDSHNYRGLSINVSTNRLIGRILKQKSERMTKDSTSEVSSREYHVFILFSNTAGY